jgi:Methyltransferase domain
LDRRQQDQHRVLSVCAGQGRDLLEVMADRPDVGDVSAVLVELEPANADAARRLAATVEAGRVEVITGDAGRLATYGGRVPADLVLMCGVLGNISDDDVRRTIAALPMLCAAGATVVWTRHRNPPDLTPSIREWLADGGFAEEAFVAPDDVKWSVGVHVFLSESRPLDRDAVMFAFR